MTIKFDKEPSDYIASGCFVTVVSGKGSTQVVASFPRKSDSEIKIRRYKEHPEEFPAVPSPAVAFPKLRNVFSSMIATEIVSIQPMSIPSGLIFYLNSFSVPVYDPLLDLGKKPPESSEK